MKINIFKKINKTNLFIKYITIRNYINKGYSECNTLKGLITIIGILSIWFKFYFPNFPFYYGIILGVFILHGWLVLGYYWDKLKLFHVEAEWGNQRNPFVEYMKTCKFKIEWDQESKNFIAKIIKNEK